MPRASTTSDPFNAIAEPRRRHILEFIAAEERSVGEIADALELQQPSVTKHLQVLANAGLVRDVRAGRERLWELEPERIEEARRSLELIEQQWDHALGKLKRAVEGTP